MTTPAQVDTDETVKCDYESDDCPKHFTRLQDMLRHKEEFHKGPKECPWCDYTAKRNSRLLDHIDENHRARPYKPRFDRKLKSTSVQQPLARKPQLEETSTTSRLAATTLDQRRPSPSNGSPSQQEQSQFARASPQAPSPYGENSGQPRSSLFPISNFGFANPTQPTSSTETHQTQARVIPMSTSTSSHHTFGYVPPSPVPQGFEANAYSSQRSTVISQQPIIKSSESSFQSSDSSTSTLVAPFYIDNRDQDIFTQPVWVPSTHSPPQDIAYSSYSNLYELSVPPQSRALDTSTSPNMALSNTLQSSSGMVSTWMSQTASQPVMPASSIDQPSSYYAPSSGNFQGYSNSYHGQYDNWGSQE